MRNNENLPAPIEPSAGLPARPVPGAYFDQGDPGGSSAFSFRRLLRGIARYKWLVAGLTLAGTVAAVFATQYVNLTYRAESRLWIEISQRADGLQGPIQSPELLRNDAWVELLRSFAVYDPVVRDKRLFVSHAPGDADLFATMDVNPDALVPGSYTLTVNGGTGEMELREASGRVVDRARSGGVLGSPIGLVWRPAISQVTGVRTASFDLMNLRQAAARLDSRIDARLARGGNFMWVTYTAEDPRKAADVANAVTERYVELAAELKRAKLDELREILNRQMQFAEGNLRQAELSLERFRVATITLPTDAAPVAAGLEATRAPVMSAFFDLKIERETRQRDRTNIQRAISASDGRVSVDALSAVPAVRESPELMQALSALASRRAEHRALLLQYTPEHPLVVRAAADVEEMERGSVPALARRLLAQLDQELSQLDERVDDASTELRQIPSRVIDEARYRREVASSENLFNDLRQRYEAARLAAETTVPDVRILDPATPPHNPALDERLKLVFAGFAGSFALSLLLAFGLDRMDPRLRYAEQVTDDMGLTIIGAVPSIGAQKRLGRRGGRHADPTPGGTPHVTEAFRSIRLNLMHAYGSAGPMMITVTSPGAGDGKTFLTSNLGLAYADLGRRVLVIDGDTRRGCVHRVFQVDRKPGLVDYLMSKAPVGDVVRSTSHPLLNVIPCGSRTSSAPELLSSHLVGELLAAIRDEYDVILVDSPPLGAGVDPLVLGTLTGNVLLVMRTGNTERAMAEAKLRMLDRLPVRLLGTVLNGFDAGDSYRYYSYMPGYEGSDEDAPTGTNLLQRA
jgi:polysaccharide biosynthesis transport protein